METVLWFVLGAVTLFLFLACISKVVLSIEEIALFKRMIPWVYLIMVIAIIVGNCFFEVPRPTSFGMLGIVFFDAILQKKAQDNFYCQLFSFLMSNPVGVFMPDSEDKEEGGVFYGRVNIEGKVMNAVGVDAKYEIGKKAASFVYVELDDNGDFKELQVVKCPQEFAEGSV